MADKLTDLGTPDLRQVPDEMLQRFKNLSDDEVLRASCSLDVFAIAESNRRLKNALISEERTIKKLTWVLVVLTFVLVILACKPLVKSLWKL